jgi:hypothetical protein
VRTISGEQFAGRGGAPVRSDPRVICQSRDGGKNTDCITGPGEPTAHYRRHWLCRALATERRDSAPARMTARAAREIPREAAARILIEALYSILEAADATLC